MAKPKRKFIVAGVGVLALALIVYRLFFPGIPFLLDYMKADNFTDSYTTSEVSIPAGLRTIPGRLYTPANGQYSGTILLIHGVHSDGYTEKRLIHFTSTLVHNGFRVLTPDISDLRNYHIVARAVDDIEQAALWLINESALMKKDEKFALWGISFAGGLCLSLAASPRLRDRVSSAFSFGGHGDLDATMHYLMTGETPDGPLPPHVYGQAVLVRRFASRLVPPDQVTLLQDIIYEYLRGNIRAAKTRSREAPAASRKWLKLIFKRDVKQLGVALGQAVGKPHTAARLSATRGNPPVCSVHLLHGSLDNVIPPSELHRLERWANTGDAKVYPLVSELINHVELEENQPFHLVGYLRIIRFWNELLRNSD